jgi:hypothetical protein
VSDSNITYFAKLIILDHKKDSFHRHIGLELRWKKPVKRYVWSIALYGAGTWTLRKIDQKYEDSFEMW